MIASNAGPNQRPGTGLPEENTPDDGIGVLSPLHRQWASTLQSSASWPRTWDQWCSWMRLLRTLDTPNVAQPHATCHFLGQEDWSWAAPQLPEAVCLGVHEDFDAVASNS